MSWLQQLLLEREEHVIELKRTIRRYEARLGIPSEGISENLRQEIMRRVESAEATDPLSRTRYVLLSLLEDLDIARRDLLRANERFRELDRLKSEFIRTASHELRTPLAAIKGAIDNLDDGLLGELTPDQRDSVALAARNVGRLSALADRLLDFARIESGAWRLDRRKMDLGVLVRELVASIGESAPSSPAVGIEVFCPVEAVIAEVDRTAIEQVLTNLLANARRFARTRIEVRLAAIGGDARISVADDGPGVPEEEIDRIFHPFVRAEGAAGGAGLGLSIARGLVEAHQGFLWCENRLPEDGSGACFVFVVPRNRRDMAPASG
jgi:NtrC-family two-component system sensor histidine kinase KinB